MSGEKSGCFTWCVRLREACNERWARFINRLRRRFYARRGQPIDPASVLNETGTKDMVLSKTLRESYIVIRDILPAGNSISADTLLSNNKINTMNADDNVSLTSSVISQIADRAVNDSLTHIVIEIDSDVADDKVDASVVPSGNA